MSDKQPKAQAGALKTTGIGVVVDAMGGDNAPAATVAGAITAARRFKDTTIYLVGSGEAIRAEIDKNGRCPANIEVVPASESIGMHESPVHAIRGKKDSSIGVGIAKLMAGGADAFVSAGNTGAVVAASTLGLRLLEGVQRPGIAVPMVALDHMVVIIDCGANIQCKPSHLVQYGIMASEFAQDVWELGNPRVGLLNVGEEEGKGTDMIKEAHELLSKTDLNFVGNVEPKSIMLDECDIVVCDGFVGNVLLKTSESVAMKFVSHLRVAIQKGLLRKIGFALCKGAFRAVQNSGDYSEYGGAPLLGVDGAIIISHGRSDARAIESAVREARSFVGRKVNEKIASAIRRTMPPEANHRAVKSEHRAASS